MAKALKFSPELEQAVLDKRKSETRRLMEPQPVHQDGGYFWPDRKDFKIGWAAEDSALGEVLSSHRPAFIFDHDSPLDVCPYGSIGRWFPVGNTTQHITGIRIERIQDITEEGALAEGVDELICPQCGYIDTLGNRASLNTQCGSEGCGLDKLSAIESFQQLWESLYPGSWERNDFCWVIQFGEVE